MRAQSAVTSFRVFPRSSAAKKHTHPRFLFRVFRGESWFPVANTVIEQSHAQLARAKAQATVSGPRNPRSRHSAFFRVFPRPKKAQREILRGAADCIVRVVDCDPGRAKLALSRMLVSPLDRPARREPRPPEGSSGSAGASPSRGIVRLGGSLALPRGCRLGGSLALPRGLLGSAGASPSRGCAGSAGASPSRGGC